MLHYKSSGRSNAEAPKYWIWLSNPRHWNAGLVSSGVSTTSWREGISLGIAGHHSSDCVAIKTTYGLWGKCFITSTSLTLIFSYWVGYNSIWSIKSFETDLGRWMLVVAVINVDASTVLAYSDLTCHLENTDQIWK